MVILVTSEGLKTPCIVECLIQNWNPNGMGATNLQSKRSEGFLRQGDREAFNAIPSYRVRLCLKTNTNIQSQDTKLRSSKAYA